MAVAPLASLSRLPHVAIWSLIQILCFNLANQGLSPEEDKLNKPFRPIPSGRISVEKVLRLRWILVIFGFIHAALYSIEVFYATIGNLIIALLYCELRVAAAHWSIRNLIGGVGYMPFLAGTTFLAG